MSMQWMQIAVVGTILTIGGPLLAAAQSSQAKSDTYTWNGELVSLDTTAKTITVKSRVAYDVLGSVRRRGTKSHGVISTRSDPAESNPDSADRLSML
jgi:hypothetical protein